MRKWIVVTIVLAVLYLAAVNNQSKVITLTAVGDIMLSRDVAKELSVRGLDYPYAKVNHLFTKDDLTVANLECPLTLRGTPVFKDRSILFKGSPANAPRLKEGGLDLLNLANNHTMDMGWEGLASTIDVLEQGGLGAFGAGNNREEAHQPIYRNIKNTKLGFLGFSVFPPEGYINFPEKPGISHVDIKTIAKEIEDAKKRCDFLVVAIHWGKEYDFYPSQDQKELARLIVDSGGDLILGHHPHVLQGIEKYQNKVIFYSLGNFVFDEQIQPGTKESIIAQIKIKDKNWQEIQLLPAVITDCQPAIVEDDKAKYILDRLNLYSQGLNSGLTINNDSVGIIRNQ